MNWRNQLEPNSYRRRLFDSLPLDTFIDLSKMKSINSPTELLLIGTPATEGLPLDFNQVGDLPFGSLDLITCGGLPCGYVVMLPRCDRKVGRNFAALIRRKPVETEVERIFDDGKLVAIGNNSAIVLTIATKKWIAP